MDTSHLQPERVKSRARLIEKFNGYVVVSAVSFFLNVGLTAFLHEIINLKPMWAYGISLIILLCMNFCLMRYWVYRQEMQPGTLKKQFVATAATSIGFRLSEWLVFIGLNEFLGLYYLLAMLIVMGISFFLKFFVYDALIFNRKQSAT
jgi:putative flippase GtrA